MKKMSLMVCLLAFAGGTSGFLGSRYHVHSISQRRSRILALPPPVLSKYHGLVPPLTSALRVPLAAAPFGPAALAKWPAVEKRPLHAKAPFSLPVAFEPNIGQADPSIQFIGRGRGLSVYLTDRGINLEVSAPQATLWTSSARIFR